ncbi:hypothetical protein D9Q98_002468 [Chlorella vulgaris]|uniref:Uncharacterized protein n=1 Tax=Chlorella vulgaris TaxID=3077 RepID=A0A9D4TTL7_CHLVU|nr:hypothetical protein D9Q98_002468 [Chlorella vulgaris]
MPSVDYWVLLKLDPGTEKPIARQALGTDANAKCSWQSSFGCIPRKYDLKGKFSVPVEKLPSNGQSLPISDTSPNVTLGTGERRLFGKDRNWTGDSFPGITLRKVSGEKLGSKWTLSTSAMLNMSRRMATPSVMFPKLSSLRPVPLAEPRRYQSSPGERV